MCIKTAGRKNTARCILLLHEYHISLVIYLHHTLAKFPVHGKIRNYIDELLVGPLSEHCCSVFAKGTKVLSCFQRDQTLFVNLSPELLASDAENTDFKAQIELFKMNVMHNFPEIKKIELFIDGKVPFEKK